MKRLFSKLHGLLDKEFEITLGKPGKQTKKTYVKDRAGYVNPFKHQQELEEKRLQEARQKQLEEVKRLREQQELQKRLLELKKSQQTKPAIPAPPPTAQPIQQQKPIIQEVKHHTEQQPMAHTAQHQPVQIMQQIPTHPPAATQPKPSSSVVQTAPPPINNPEKTQQKGPTLLDKKVEFTLKKPSIKKPQIKFPKPKLHRPNIKLPLKPTFANASQFTRKHKKPFAAGTAVFLGVAIIATVYLTTTNKPTSPTGEVKSMKIKPQQQPEQPVNPKVKIVESAKKSIELPTNEDPILATVDDPEKLKNQDFFKDARAGDKILMYPKNKKAYLYRPSSDQVLVQAPLQYQDENASVAGETATEETADSPKAGQAPVFNRPDTEYFLHGKTIVEPQE